MILAHDLGTTGNKATLVSNEGALVTSVTVAYATDFGPGGKAEQDPLAWWRASCAATGQLLERAGVAADEIDVISFSGQMMGVVPLDARGEVVRPAIIWADTRSSAESARLVEAVGMERGYKITGHRLNPTYSLSKLMWLRANEPDSFARIATVVQAKDYVAYRLTGGERSPYWNPRARAVFAGLARHHGPAHLTRAVLEGVAFNLRTGLLAFIENGKTIDNADAIGGAANGALTLEILSAVWGRRVTTRDLVDEATSMGAAVVAGVGVGVGVFEYFGVARTLSGRLESAEPDPAAAEAYLGQDELFMDLYRRLESWFELLP